MSTEISDLDRHLLGENNHHPIYYGGAPGISYMTAHPGKKLMFMGGEFGQWHEWRDHEGRASASASSAAAGLESRTEPAVSPVSAAAL